MKVFLICLFLIFAQLSSTAQVTFQTEISVPKHHVAANEVAELSDGSLILVGYKTSLTQTNSHWDTCMSYMAKLSPKGNLVAERDSFLPERTVGFFNVYSLPDNHFFAYSRSNPNELFGHDTMYFEEFNSDLKLVRSKKISFPGDTFKIYNSLMRKVKDKYFISGVAGIPKGGAKSFLYVINSNGDSLYSEFSDQSMYDDFTINSKLFACRKPMQQIECPIYLLNSDFSVNLFFDLFNIIPPPFNRFCSDKFEIQSTNDSTVILLATSCENNQRILLAKLDTLMNLKKYVTFGIPNYINRLIDVRSMSIRPNTDSIFVASNYLAWGPYSVTLLDGDLNILWEKFFDLPDSFVGSSILATKDGGCIFIASTTTNQRYNIVALKFDADGNLPGLSTGKDLVKVSEMLVYPNPGNENMTIRTAAQILGGTFVLYDISGRCILEKNITTDFETIETQNLPCGTYVYSYFYKGRLAEQGKWVKE